MAVYPVEYGKCKNANPCISRVPGFSNGLPCSDFIKRTPFYNITPDDCILCTHWVGKNYNQAVKDAMAKGYRRLPEPIAYEYDDEFLSSNESVSRYDYVNVYNDYIKAVPITSEQKYVKQEPKPKPKEWNRFAELDYS